MSDTAAAQLRRVLHIIPTLADDEEHSIDAVAARVGVNAATLRLDLRSLVTRYDEPGGFVEGVQLFLESDRVSLISNHFRRPMRLTIPELRALELGLAMLRTERPPDEHRAIDRARERLRQVIARLPGDEVPEHAQHADIGAGVSTGHLASIRGAMRQHRKLRLVYRRGDRSEASERVICAYALAVASGMFYVVAYCERSEAIRIFRLDRVDTATATDETFAIPAGFSLDDVLADGRVLHMDQPRTVRIRYSPRIARWIAEREGGALDADGSLTREHPLADTAWAVRHVLQYGADAEVIAPPDVRAAVRDRLQAMTTG